jgi:two-component system chemotaxis sensor kinase CheA
MSFEVDEEIMQDFLVEAGEILEQLQEQLVELENNPGDGELLNAIFRGYHTVKGGAGFLALTELVEICHGAENVFDVMRNGQRTLTPELMDVILQATDVVVVMFENVKSREPLVAAPASLIDVLHKLSTPEHADEVILEDASSDVGQGTTNDVDETATGPSIEDTHVATPSKTAGGASINEINEDEFEALLDELHGAGGPTAKIPGSGGKSPKTQNQTSTTIASNGNNEISDDEFEALLDELHGQGSFKTDSGTPPSDVSLGPDMSTKSPASKADDDEISDDEFEALLDNLHGKGQAPIIAQPAVDSNADSESTKAAVAKPANNNNQNAQAHAAQLPKETQAQPTLPTSVAKAQTAPVPGKKAEAKSAPPQGETTVRVDTKRLDQIMNMVGELVLVRNRLLSLGANLADESMSKAIANLDVVTGDLQGAVMQTRMQPIKKVFGRFPRVVRDLARTLKKEISLVLEGEETDLDKNLVEALADPLVHLVRNSVDHGIEMPDEREAAGKPRIGTVKLGASQEGDHILLTIFDDGKGMDAEKLKEIAISRGVLDADSAARMSDVEAFSLIFAPGFSTKTEISEVSGRGVGMDVVKTKINQLNGTININSAMGVGTTLEIKVPLTLAILPTLMIIVGKQTFALPLGSVNEIINMNINKTNTVDNQLTMIVRSKAIPLFYLNDWLNPHKPIEDRTQGHVVVVQIGTQQIGLVVDSLIGQEEVVIKPLDALLQGTAGMAGATITSDGGIALILDIASLLKRYV